MPGEGDRRTVPVVVSNSTVPPAIAAVLCGALLPSVTACWTGSRWQTIFLAIPSGHHLPPSPVYTQTANKCCLPAFRRPVKQIALILCPNTALCQQVIRLVHSLTSPADGKPLLKACQVSSSNPPPFDPPDIVVTTPGALVTLFNDRGANYGPQWTAEGLSSRAVFVVVDEADLLSQGGYEKDLTRLLDVSRANNRSSASVAGCVADCIMLHDALVSRA